MNTKYTIQHVGYPVAGRCIVPDEWHKLSVHASLWAAMRAIMRYNDHLQYGSWDDHYRILNPEGVLVDESQLMDEREKHK